MLNVTVEMHNLCSHRNSSEANSRLAAQWIPRVLFNPKVHCRAYYYITFEMYKFCFQSCGIMTYNQRLIFE
jgi:hypothetical protein